MQIVDNKALVLRTRYPDKYAVIPRSKHVSDLGNGLHEVAVYWGLDEARVLKNLGVREVPSPILRSYKWPGKYKPFAHQKETASFLRCTAAPSCFLNPALAKRCRLYGLQIT